MDTAQSLFLGNHRTSRKGFSLLELLVVISIIGILIALGAVSYTTAQKKARDAKRRGDMKAMQAAFEQYYADPVNNSSYPTTCSDIGSFMPGGLPSDPKDTAPYTYAETCAATSFCFCANLESESGNSANGSCGWGAGDYFCVTNQQ